MALHIVNRSPRQDTALSDCLRLAAASEALLLIEDGVYAAVAMTPACRQLEERGIACYALTEDVRARGLSSRLGENVALVDYSGFVDLCEAHACIQSWF